MSKEFPGNWDALRNCAIYPFTGSVVGGSLRSRINTFFWKINILLSRIARIFPYVRALETQIDYKTRNHKRLDTILVVLAMTLCEKNGDAPECITKLVTRPAQAWAVGLLSFFHSFVYCGINFGDECTYTGIEEQYGMEIQSQIESMNHRSWVPEAVKGFKAPNKPVDK